ncbi:MAG: class I SAM-dependent methyltransferase family protein [Candidatus Thermoplasmatota archaeon]
MSEEEKPVLRVPKEKGQEYLERVKEENNLDPARQIQEDRGELLIPVKKGGTETTSDLKERDTPGKISPYMQIQQKIDLPEKKKDKLPDRWEMIGEVLLIKLPVELSNRKEEVAEVYAEVLGAKTVMQQGSIKGKEREPVVEKVYGKETETVHVENGVLYKLDTAELMFSSGNIDERVRATKLVEKDEVVVDMFAGIGYFSLPAAVHCQPENVYSLEINPTAFRYLKENIDLNGVEETVEPWCGDNRDFSFSGADRVFMGYLHETWKFLDKAVEFLKGEGVVHYHTTCSDSRYPEQVKDELEENIDPDFEMKNIRKVKSYAPHVFHVVSDVRVEG